MKVLTIISSAILLITLLGIKQGWFDLTYGETITTILTINMFLCPVLAIITSAISIKEDK